MTARIDVGVQHVDDTHREEKHESSDACQITEEAALSSDNLLPQAVVFAALVLGGVTTFAVVAFAQVDWFLPALIYGCAIYVAWLKFYNSRGEAREAGGRASINAQLQLLEGRMTAMMGYVLGEASMKPGNPMEYNDRDRIEEAISLSQRGYALLEELGGPTKYMALNNLLFYSAVLSDSSKSNYLLSKARELLRKGQENSINNLVLTACRVILQFSGQKEERVQALALLRSLRDADLTTNRERKEAALYVEHFSQEPYGNGSAAPNPRLPADA